MSCDNLTDPNAEQFDDLGGYTKYSLTIDMFDMSIKFQNPDGTKYTDKTWKEYLENIGMGGVKKYETGSFVYYKSGDSPALKISSYKLIDGTMYEGEDNEIVYKNQNTHEGISEYTLIKVTGNYTIQCSDGEKDTTIGYTLYKATGTYKYREYGEDRGEMLDWSSAITITEAYYLIKVDGRKLYMFGASIENNSTYTYSSANNMMGGYTTGTLESPSEYDTFKK